MSKTGSILVVWVIFLNTCTGPSPVLSLIPVGNNSSSQSGMEDLPVERKINASPGDSIVTGNTKRDELVEFAKTMIGTPYLYASTDPAKGFDCSGFITYVFNHFHVSVPRSSVDFTNRGKAIPEDEAKQGDLILFTGTDSTIRIVGHMGIVVSNTDGLLEFIHSTSGKQKGVVITPFKDYYRSRFVKVIRVFPT